MSRVIAGWITLGLAVGVPTGLLLKTDAPAPTQAGAIDPRIEQGWATSLEEARAEFVVRPQAWEAAHRYLLVLTQLRETRAPCTELPPTPEQLRLLERLAELPHTPKQEAWRETLERRVLTPFFPVVE